MKTLIVYATKYGSAEKCANLIAQNLNGACDVIDARNSAGVNIKEYDRIVIGSAVYAGNILPQAKTFCENNATALKGKQLGLFLTCMGFDENLIQGQLEAGFGGELVSHAVAADFLGGVFDFKKMNFFERTIIKMIGKKLKKEGKTDLVIDGKSRIDTISSDRISIFAGKLILA